MVPPADQPSCSTDQPGTRLKAGVQACARLIGLLASGSPIEPTIPTLPVHCFINVHVQDKRVTQEEWAALKPQTPFGQIPVLEVGGRHIAQSAAIGE